MGFPLFGKSLNSSSLIAKVPEVFRRLKQEEEQINKMLYILDFKKFCSFKNMYLRIKTSFSFQPQSSLGPVVNMILFPNIINFFPRRY